MRKVFPFVALLFFITQESKAQQLEKFDPKNDKKEINGYTIRLVPVPGNTFGFSIVKGNKAVWSQLNNPFIQGQDGFKIKADAYKLAEWIVQQDSRDSRIPAYIPRELSKQLNISTEVSPK